MARAFEHLRVLDLSWGMAGPMTTMFLADNGADVVRIESPLGDPFSEQTGYRVWNRGKRSACIDLQGVEGRQQFDRLVRAADVVVDSFSLGTTARLGIDHDALSALNSQIITCSITAYGEHPAHRDRPGYDGLVAARTGLLFDQKGRRGTAMEFINGRPGPYPEFAAPEGLVRGADRDGPIFPRTPWPSIGATYFATLGIAAALRAATDQRPGPACDHIAAAGRVGRVVPELAACREPGCAAVLDVARRRAIDRGPLRMCGRQVGPSLDTSPPLGAGRCRRGHALCDRARHFVPGRS